MGKGSAPRHGRYDRPLPGFPGKVLPGVIDNRTPQEKYEDNWDAIFGNKGKEPDDQEKR